MAAKPHVKSVGTGFTVLPGGNFTKETDGPADVQDWSEQTALMDAANALLMLAMQIDTSGGGQDPAHPLAARRAALSAQFDFLLWWRLLTMIAALAAQASQAQVGDVLESPVETNAIVTWNGRRFSLGLKATCTQVLP